MARLRASRWAWKRRAVARQADIRRTDCWRLRYPANSADTTLAALEDMLTRKAKSTLAQSWAVLNHHFRHQKPAGLIPLVAQLAPDIKKLQRAAGEGAFSMPTCKLLLRSMPNATTDEKANL